MKRVIIIGAGLAGLSAAYYLDPKKYRIHIFESAKQAGGRCRSFWDDSIGGIIDNGTHLILGCNHHALGLIGELKTTDQLRALGLNYHFYDLGLKFLWCFQPRRWWKTMPTLKGHALFVRDCLKLMLARSDQSTADILGKSALAEPFWKNMVESILNTPFEQASARLMRQTLKEIIRTYPAGFKAYTAQKGLSSLLIAPLQQALRSRGVVFHYGKGLKEIKQDYLYFSDDYKMRRQSNDMMILALPAASLKKILPESDELKPKVLHESILNIHFKKSKLPDFPIGFCGVCSGLSQWVFDKGSHISVTISAANKQQELDHDDMVKKVWQEVCQIYGVKAPLPPHRVVWEKRATGLQANEIADLMPVTLPPSTYIIGDWTIKDLPQTIESSIMSGVDCARRLNKKLNNPKNRRST